MSAASEPRTESVPGVFVRSSAPSKVCPPRTKRASASCSDFASPLARASNSSVEGARPGSRPSPVREAVDGGNQRRHLSEKDARIRQAAVGRPIAGKAELSERRVDGDARGAGAALRAFERRVEFERGADGLRAPVTVEVQAQTAVGGRPTQQGVADIDPRRPMVGRERRVRHLRPCRESLGNGGRASVLSSARAASRLRLTLAPRKESCTGEN